MSTSRYPHLLQPFRLRHLTFRNRVMSTSHAPGYVEDRHPKLRYQLYLVFYSDCRYAEAQI